jgi:hypothetical protein
MLAASHRDNPSAADVEWPRTDTAEIDRAASAIIMEDERNTAPLIAGLPAAAGPAFNRSTGIA